MNKPFDFFYRFWLTEWSLSALTATLVIYIFAIFPLADVGWVGRIVRSTFFTLLLMSGAVAVGRLKIRPVPVIAIVALTVLVHWASLLRSSEVLDTLERALFLLSLMILAAIVLARVFASGPVNVHRIQGAVCAYLLLGLMWATAYSIAQIVHPGAIQFPASQAEPRQHGSEFVYYSFVTLTTLGYGDMIPTIPATRSLATLEALVGQLYPAILIARLVSLELSDRERGKK
ncbi:MAG TPA: potassium channel family protein [Terriglobales bacterium]|nr:potassium channel family protein [Terriglobales bacterium]